MTNHEFLAALEDGSLRAASRDDKGQWCTNKDVKQRILDIFKNSKTVEMPGGFRDKEPLTPRAFEARDAVRLVPGGTSVRRGAFIGKNVVIMPPSYINVGAHIDDGTMIDSHVLVGSCAQIGKNVHLSAGAQIGGVLEPVGSRPVIVEDNCFIGANAVLVEGVCVRRGAVIAPGVVFSGSVPLYDLKNNTLSSNEIPENAVVVPGSRPAMTGAMQPGLQLYCPIIVKYRNDSTDEATKLEEALRQ